MWRKDGLPTALAVVWKEIVHAETGEVTPCFVMVSVPANAALMEVGEELVEQGVAGQIDRMPAVMADRDWAAWLGETGADLGQINGMLLHGRIRGCLGADRAAAKIQGKTEATSTAAADVSLLTQRFFSGCSPEASMTVRLGFPHPRRRRDGIRPVRKFYQCAETRRPSRLPVMALVEAERHVDMDTLTLTLIAPGAPRQRHQRFIRTERNYRVRDFHRARVPTARRPASEIDMRGADASEGKQVIVCVLRGHGNK